jgi:hypothetical protein
MPGFMLVPTFSNFINSDNPNEIWRRVPDADRMEAVLMLYGRVTLSGSEISNASNDAFMEAILDRRLAEMKRDWMNSWHRRNFERGTATVDMENYSIIDKSLGQSHKPVAKIL